MASLDFDKDFIIRQLSIALEECEAEKDKLLLELIDAYGRVLKVSKLWSTRVQEVRTFVSQN